MRNRVERLRVWLLGSAIFLMLVIAAFIVSARYVARIRKLAALPAKLGIDVKGDASGYTVSRTVGSKTIFTLHAARWEQHTDGKYALHDVSVILYGKNGDRHDRIYGDEFEYDTKQGLVRAMGLVHIDLEATEAEAAVRGGAAKVPHAGTPMPPRVLHVTTSGLVYLEHLGVAATSEPIEFESGGLTGHATGADYSSDTGTLMLHSAVSISGLAGKRPVLVTAATAELDSRSEQTFLTHAKYTSEGQTAEADAATLHTRPDGSLARVEAQGRVTARADGATVVSQRADVSLNAASQPQNVVLTGSVGYSVEMPLRQVKAQADAATIAFDGQARPQPQLAVLTGGVHMTERTRATAAAGERWSVRDLTAAKFEAALVPGGPDQSQLRDAEATGGARLVTTSGSAKPANGAGGAGVQTEIAADDLKAHFASGGGAKGLQLETLGGRGHTELRQTGAEGVEQTSLGETLDVKFRPGAAKPTRAKTETATAPLATQEIASAVQQGHVVMTRQAPAKGGAGAKAGAQGGSREDVQRATAERAVYDGEADRMTLSGGVRLTDAGSEMWANRVALDHKTGDSQATGAVKVNYVQAAAAEALTAANAVQQEPTHILSDRADYIHATDVATFFGAPVRMWQGGSQVEAPVIELSRRQGRLSARGDASAARPGAAQVHTVMVSAGAGLQRPAAATAKPGPRPDAAKAAAGTGEVVRIASGALVYLGAQHQADFTGGVLAQTVDGSIRASEAVVTLQPGAPAGAGGVADASSATDVPSMAGRLDRVVASGDVEIEQPGLHATGTRLVYTQTDGLFVLTGDKSAPPKAIDADGTTTTGAELRFRSSDRGVEALGAAPGQPTQRVRTVSRVTGDQELMKRP